MQLQLALDGTLANGLHILQQVHSYVDIIEVGTPLIFREGMNAVRVIHDLYPEKQILADLKIMDAGDEEANIAFTAGASLVTVLGLTSDTTIRAVIDAAQRHQGQVFVDMIQVGDDNKRGRRLIDLGCDYLCIHTAADLQQAGDNPYEALERLRGHLPHASLAVAGGINAGNVGAYVAFNPAIIVSGSGISNADDPALAARQIKEKITWAM